MITEKRIANARKRVQVSHAECGALAWRTQELEQRIRHRGYCEACPGVAACFDVDKDWAYGHIREL